MKMGERAGGGPRPAASGAREGGGAGAYTLRAPVALFAFNRPEVTARVFAAIRAARPSRLFVVCDGPRDDHPADAARCAEVRRVLGEVDWPCTVERNYSEVNLGCGARPASGIDWVFTHADEAIFLEDDILPDPTFFRYCDELLERYRTDERVLTVSGYNAFGESGGIAASYWFSAYPRSWGWASWRRAWEGFDFEMKGWPAFRAGPKWRRLAAEEREAYGPWMEDVHAGLPTIWDAQLLLMAWQKGALTAIPRRNLVENLGFGADATNTPTVPALCPSGTWPMAFPLAHPTSVVRDRAQELRWVRREHGISGTAAGRAFRRNLRRAARWLRAKTWRRGAASRRDVG